jgi:hypothetical protein
LNTHDVLAFAIAREAVRLIRAGDTEWTTFTGAAYTTSTRVWPLPDFVIADDDVGIYAAAEFKPPDQTKREYLTGLGQALAYTRDFTYGVLVVPSVANDGFRIGDHLAQVIDQDVADSLPLVLLEYDPRTISATAPGFSMRHAFRPRSGPAPARPAVENSFWAKWREISPQELGLYLTFLYEEGWKAGTGTVRDRAWDQMWAAIQGGDAMNWSGGVRHMANTPTNKVAWAKNYRNFLSHLGWCLPDGKLTASGLNALRLAHQYGPESTVFTDNLARSLLLEGKHLVLINSINEFQERARGYASEQAWLDSMERDLETSGMLKRNPARHAAAVLMVSRGFFKAEKTIWRNLGLFEPYGPGGGRAYHPGRGLVFNWRRITDLIGADASAS